MGSGTRFGVVLALVCAAGAFATSAQAAQVAERGSMQQRASGSALMAGPGSADAGPTAPGPGGSPFCEGDGTSGPRIQAVYGYIAGQPNNIATEASTIRTMASAIDDAYDMSAGRQGGSAHPRWATVPGTCELSVLAVELPVGAADDLDKTVGALAALGLTSRTDRKYLVWVDATGNENLIAQTRFDDSPNPATNLSDGGQSSALVAQLARNGGWDTDGIGGPTIRWGPQHEVSHLLGAVNTSAPHSDGSGHCTDEYDAMCNGDPNAATCTPLATAKVLLDCGADDYFAVNPAPGSYLDTHWNTYDSSFLVRTDTPDLPPETTITSAPSGTVATAQATFQFNSNEAGGFECSLDGAGFSGCSSPASLSGLPNGAHTFRVRAKDPAGNLDPSPAEATWTVAVPGGDPPGGGGGGGGGGGSKAPDTRIDGAKVKAKKGAAKFTFSADDESAGFECRLDQKPFATCTSPLKLKRLKRGKHVLSVRAVLAGVPDPTPAQSKFKIKRR